MQQVYTHEGSYESIPSTAPPGLQFLKHFLPALDSLDPNAHPVSPFIHPDARVFVGSGPPNRGTDVVGLLNVRQRHIKYFHHDVHRARDIGDGTATGPRTVMFEATSGTIFRNDPDEFEVRVKEFNILELERSGSGSKSQSDGDDEGNGGFCRGRDADVHGCSTGAGPGVRYLSTVFGICALQIFDASYARRQG